MARNPTVMKSASPAGTLSPTFDCPSIGKVAATLSTPREFAFAMVASIEPAARAGTSAGGSTLA